MPAIADELAQQGAELLRYMESQGASVVALEGPSPKALGIGYDEVLLIEGRAAAARNKDTFQA